MTRVPRRIAGLAMALLVMAGALPCAGQEAATTPPATATGDTPQLPAARAEAKPASTRVASDPAADDNLSPGGAWIAKLRQGGAIVGVQILLSVIGLTYVIGSFITLRRRKFVPEGLKDRARALWDSGNFEALEQLEREAPSTLGRIVAFLARHRRNSLQDVNVTAGDMASREISLGLRRAYPISVIGSLLPLLGLLGTVFGMIECFDTVALAGDMGDPTLLAGGISKALVTTAVGLSLAIPLLYAYHHLKSKCNEYAALLEEDAGDLITLWFLDPAAGREPAATGTPQ